MFVSGVATHCWTEKDRNICQGEMDSALMWRLVLVSWKDMNPFPVFWRGGHGGGGLGKPKSFTCWGAGSQYSKRHVSVSERGGWCLLCPCQCSSFPEGEHLWWTPRPMTALSKGSQCHCSLRGTRGPRLYRVLGLQMDEGIRYGVGIVTSFFHCSPPPINKFSGIEARRLMSAGACEWVREGWNKLYSLFSFFILTQRPCRKAFLLPDRWQTGRDSCR